MQPRVHSRCRARASCVAAVCCLVSIGGCALGGPGDSAMQGSRRTTVFDDVGRICEAGCPSFVRFTGDDEKFINRAWSPFGKAGGQAHWTSSVEYHAVQRRDDASDAPTFPRTDGPPAVVNGPAGGAVVRIREATVTPAAVHRGKPFVIATDYSLVSMDGAKELEIAEEWHVRHVQAGADRRRWRPPPDLSVYAVKQRRRPGGWHVAVTIGVPENALPGNYQVEFYLNTGTHQDRRNVEFVVD